MKHLILLLLLITIVSCKQSEDIDYAIFSGKITNSNSEKGSIRSTNGDNVKAVKINKNGTFIDTIFNASGYYNFSDGDERTAIYLENGFKLNITLDTKEFDETIKYTGSGGQENNYMAKKYLLEEKIGEQKEIFTLEEVDFLKKYNKFYEKLNKELSALANDKFTTLEKVNIKYEKAMKLGDYENAHRYFAKNRDFKVSDTFPDITESEIFDDEDKFKTFTAYQRLTSKSFFAKANKKSKKDSISFQEAAITDIKSIKSQLIKNHILSGLSSRIRLENKKYEDLYNAIMKLSTDEEFKTEITKKFKTLSKLVEGSISPKFNNYENNNGGTSSLDDFKGKYVYIDVWATWCAPCKAEIPSLKKIEEQYKNKDIVFVSISIDKQKAHDAWKKMIVDLEMGGVQLFADKDWKSSFILDYGIRGIPRFILIDKDGKIISSSAPRPSNPALVALFDKVGI